MGKTMMGGVNRAENVSMLTPQQEQLFSQALGNLGPEFLNAYQEMLRQKSPEEYQDIFQQSYVNPALQTYSQQVVPAIQQRFADANASSSSALNQALAQSAGDLSTSLGSNYGNFLQNQQGRQMQALNSFSPYLTQQTFTPRFQQQQGILGPLISAQGDIASGGLNAFAQIAPFLL